VQSMWYNFAMSKISASEINGDGTAFVAAWLPTAARKAFDHIKGLDENLHMTILYVPKGIDKTEDRQKIVDVLTSVCDKTSPIKCQLTAISIMGNEEKSLVANVNCVDGAELYTNIVDAIEKKLGCEIERTYGFLPHISIKVNGDGNTADIKDLRKFRWTIDEITVQFGDSKRFKTYTFKLKGGK